MIPAAFEYRAPASIEEAISILQENEDEGKILAGGHSLLPLMKLRLSAPGLLIDLGRIPTLRYIEDRGDMVAIGAMTPHVMIEQSDVLRQRAPLLSQTAGLSTSGRFSRASAPADGRSKTNERVSATGVAKLMRRLRLCVAAWTSSTKEPCW